MLETMGPPRSELQRLLRDFNEYPDRREAVCAEIEQRFTRRIGLMVIDSCSFSKLVQNRGIIPFLAMLERLDRIIAPVVERHGGRMLKEEADNFFAAFPDAGSALACAGEICRNLEIANEPLPADDEIQVSIGVGYGDVLMIGSDDAYGDEMNLACKLGEDLADEQEILLTERAYQGLGDRFWDLERVEYTVSGLNLPAYRFSDGASS